MPTAPAVAVVAYGRPDLLDQALAPLWDRFDLVVVDNSLDDDVQAVAERYGAAYERPDRNLGFAAGVNRALARLTGRDVLLLNPDAVITEDGVARLAEHLRRDPRLAAVAPRLERSDGAEERSMWPMPGPALPWYGVLGLAPRSGERFCNGAVLLLSARALARVGTFDERFFLYAEEADWQRRAQRDGWQVRVAGDVTARHVGAATSSDEVLRDVLFHAGAETFIRKWHGTTGWTVFRAGSVAAALRRWLVPGARDAQLRQRQTRALALYLRGPRAALPPWACR